MRFILRIGFGILPTFSILGPTVLGITRLVFVSKHLIGQHDQATCCWHVKCKVPGLSANRQTLLHHSKLYMKLNFVCIC